MINTGGDTKNPFAVRNGEITTSSTCIRPLAEHEHMVEEEEETLAAGAFIGSFTSVQPGFRLRLLLIAHDDHYSSMSAHYCHLGVNSAAHSTADETRADFTLPVAVLKTSQKCSQALVSWINVCMTQVLFMRL